MLVIQNQWTLHQRYRVLVVVVVPTLVVLILFWSDLLILRLHLRPRHAILHRI